MKWLVVARWNEDTGWIHDAPLDWKRWVIQKDVDVPNQGREGSTFHYALSHLYQYVDDDDVVACVQGRPFDHCEHLFHALEQPIDRYTPLGHWNVVDDIEGHPHHPGLPIAECWRNWEIEGDPPSHVSFWAGGQFAVTGREIKSRPAAWYVRMVDEMSHGQAPWVMERLWGYVWPSST